jgi:hypothetical protein
MAGGGAGAGGGGGSRGVQGVFGAGAVPLEPSTLGVLGKQA